MDEVYSGPSQGQVEGEGSAHIKHRVVPDLFEDPDLWYIESVTPERAYYAIFLCFILATTLSTLVSHLHHRKRAGATPLRARLQLLPARIAFYFGLYYMLPALIAWHGTMLIK